MNAAVNPVADKPFPVEKLPDGWMTARVTYRHHDGRLDNRLEVIHIKTNTRYWHDPLVGIATKCALLAFAGIFFYSLGYMGWNAIRIPTTAISEIVLGFKNASTAEGLLAKWKFAAGGFSNSLSALVSGVWTLARAPIFLLGMWFTAIYGIVKPLGGRIAFGVIEQKLHQKTARQDYIVNRPDGMTDSDLLIRALKEKDFEGTNFLAYCMQPWGKTTDPHIVAVEEVHPAPLA